MSPLQDEQVLDEGLSPNGHTSKTQQGVSSEGSLSSTASCFQVPKVNSQDQKTGSPPSTNALRHPSTRSTANGTTAEEKSNESTQAPSKQLSSGPENEESSPEAFNRVPVAPPEASIPGEKIGQQDEAGPQDEAAGAKYPEGGLRAWLVVLGAFSGMTASFGNLNSTGTFQAYLSTHQLAHESPGAIGWIFSLYAFLTFFCGVQIGPVFDAYGPRWLVFVGTFCLFGGMMGVAESTKLWHFILTYSVLCGIGSSLIFTPAIGSIAHFFDKRRAATTGLASTGGSAGGIIFPLMLQRLFPEVGFKWATRILAFLSLFLLCVANLLIRGRLQPSRDSQVVRDIWPDWRIFKNRVFSLITVGVFFIEWALFIPLSYISSYALAGGISPALSYQLLAILNAGSFFGRWAPGYMADLFGRFNTMIITVALCLISVLAVWLTDSPQDGSRGIAQLIIFCVFFGFASGSNICLTPVCVGQLCDNEVFGRWYAGLYTVVSFGCLTGVPIAGQLLASGKGNYDVLIGFVGACYAAGLVCFIWARVLKVGWGLRKIY